MIEPNYEGVNRLTQIILKSGYVINVKSDTSVEDIKAVILRRDDFISIGNSFIRVEDISAVLTTA